MSQRCCEDEMMCALGSAQSLAHRGPYTVTVISSDAVAMIWSHTCWSSLVHISVSIVFSSTVLLCLPVSASSPVFPAVSTLLPMVFYNCSVRTLHTTVVSIVLYNLP